MRFNRVCLRQHEYIYPDRIENICYFEVCHWETCPLEDNVFTWGGLGLLVVQQGVTDFVDVRLVHVRNHAHSVFRPMQEGQCGLVRHGIMC